MQKFLLLIADWACKSAPKRAKTCARLVRVLTELPFCMSPLLAGSPPLPELILVNKNAEMLTFLLPAKVADPWPLFPAPSTRLTPPTNVAIANLVPLFKKIRANGLCYLQVVCVCVCLVVFQVMEGGGVQLGATQNSTPTTGGVRCWCGSSGTKCWLPMSARDREREEGKKKEFLGVQERKGTRRNSSNQVLSLFFSLLSLLLSLSPSLSFSVSLLSLSSLSFSLSPLSQIFFSSSSSSISKGDFSRFT